VSKNLVNNVKRREILAIVEVNGLIAACGSLHCRLNLHLEENPPFLFTPL